MILYVPVPGVHEMLAHISKLLGPLADLTQEMLC